MKQMFAALTLSSALLFSPMVIAEERLNAFDVEWLKQTAENDMFEIELGSLAKKKCANTSGRMFGEMLVDHHSMHLEKLKTIAAQKGVVVPTVPNPTQVLVLRYFVTSKSPDWCYDFAQYEVEDHKNAIALTEDETFLGDDADVVSFAVKTLPTLKLHLKTATDVAAQILGN